MGQGCLGSQGPHFLVLLWTVPLGSLLSNKGLWLVLLLQHTM